MQEPGSYVDIVDRCVTGRIMIDSIINAFVPPQPPLTPSTAADSPGSPGATTTTAASPRCCAAPTTPARPPAAPTPALQPMPHQHPSGRRKRTHAFVPLLSPHGALVSPAPLHAPPPTPPPPPQSHAKRYRESRDMSPVNRRHALPPQPHDAAPRRQSPDPCRATPFWGEGARGGSVRVSSRSSSVQSLQGGAGLCDTWVGDECVASQRGCAGVVDEGCCPRSPSGAVVLEAASDFTCGVVHHSSLRRRDEVFSMPLPAVPAAVDGHVRAVQPAHVGRPGHPQPVIMHSPITPAAARQVAVSPVSTQVPRRGLRSPPLRCDEGGAGGVRVGGGIAPLDVSSILVGRQLEWDARDLNSSRISALLEDPLTSLSSARASDPQAVHWGERRASPAAVPAPLPLPKAPGSGRYSIPRLPRSDAPAAEPQPLPPGVLLEAEVHPPVPLLPAAGQHLPDLHAWGAPPLRLPESSCDGSMRAAALLAAAAGQHHTPLHHRAAPLPRNVSPPRALRAPSPLALVAGPGTGPEAAAAAAVLGDAVLLDIAHDTPAPPPKSLELLLYENLSSTAAAEAKRRLRGAQARLLSAMQARLAKALLQRRFAQWRAWRDTALAADYFDEPVLALSGISITPSHTLQALHDSTDACTQTPHAAASPALSATASSVSTAKSQSKSPRMRLRQMLAEESVGYVMGVTACTFVSYIYERLGAYQSGTQWFFLPSQLSGGVLTNDIHLPIPPFHPERSVVQGGEQLPSPRTEPLDEGDSQRSSLDETLDAPATPETPKTDESGDLPLRPVVSTASITDTPLESPCLSASQPGGVVLMGHSGPLSDPAQPESTSTAGGLGGEMRKEQKKLATRSPRHQKVLSPKMRPPEHVLERADAVQPPVQSQTLRQQSSGMLSVKPLSNSLSALSTGEHDPAALLKMEGHKPDQSMVESLERSCLSIAGAVATSQAVKKLVESIGAKGNDSSTNKLDQSNGAFSVLDLNGSTESDGVRKAQQQEQDRASALSGDGGSGHLTPPTRSPTTGPVNLSPKSGPCRHLPARQRRTSKLLGDPGHPKDEYLERFSPRAANVSGGGQSTSSSMKSNPSHHADASPHASHDSREGFELQQHPITARLARDSGRSEMTLHPGESSSSSRGGTDHMLPPPARQPRRTRAPPPDGGGHRVADVEYAVGDSLELDPTDRGGVPRHPKERAVVCVTSPNDLKRAAVAGGTQRVRMREVVLTQRVSQPPALASPPRRRGWSGGPVGGAAAAQGAAAAAAAAGGGADRSGGADGGSTAVLSHSPAGVVARTLALAHTSPPRPVDALRDTSPRRHRSASPPGMAGCVGGLSPLSDVEDYAVCSAVGSRGASPVRSVRSVRSLRSVREVEEVHVSVSSSMVSELNRLRAENESLRRQQHQRVSPVRRAVDLEPPQAVVHEQFDHDPRASPHRHRPTVLIPVTNPRDFRSEVLPSSRTRNIEDIPMRVPLQGRR